MGLTSWRCGMRQGGKCESCDEGVVEDIVHFLLHCGEFAGDRGRLFGMIEGIEEWMAEWRNKGDEDIVSLLLSRAVAGVKEKVSVSIRRLVLFFWKMYSNVWHLGPGLCHTPLPSFLSPPHLPKLSLVPLLLQIIHTMQLFF